MHRMLALVGLWLAMMASTAHAQAKAPTDFEFLDFGAGPLSTLDQRSRMQVDTARISVCRRPYGAQGRPRIVIILDLGST
ncbi:MAG: hypothetical protein H6682_04605 [Candidatus Eisenbacteria bacterium]|nr:hypothetical protein [Candidatus Eisenbacteria bacterium]